MNTMSSQRVKEIIAANDGDRMNSLAILEDVQREYNFLPRAAIEQIAKELHMPLGHVYQLATFFKAFSLSPKGEHQCKVCLGTACHVKGGALILETLEKELKVKAGSDHGRRQVLARRGALPGRVCARAHRRGRQPAAGPDDRRRGGAQGAGGRRAQGRSRACCRARPHTEARRAHAKARGGHVGCAAAELATDSTDYTDCSPLSQKISEIRAIRG